MIVKFRKIPGQFITIDRFPIDNDSMISYRAKGVLTYLMGRPEDWTPNQKEIASHSCDGIKAIKSAVKELQDAGYIQLSRLYDDKTHRSIGWEWIVTDNPKAQKGLSESESPKTDFPKKDFDNNNERELKGSGGGGLLTDGATSKIAQAEKTESTNIINFATAKKPPQPPFLKILSPSEEAERKNLLQQQARQLLGG
jgi:hypothetical protein